jgi:hypothetical protein
MVFRIQPMKFALLALLAAVAQANVLVDYALNKAGAIHTTTQWLFSDCGPP